MTKHDLESARVLLKHFISDGEIDTVRQDSFSDRENRALRIEIDRLITALNVAKMDLIDSSVYDWSKI